MAEEVSEAVVSLTVNEAPKETESGSSGGAFGYLALLYLILIAGYRQLYK
ncbi:GlyGly-CTERM sorting domain-containing protein [uncultured Shewanella sp.]|nr:GlyGly-CTERM sorting domain-containing protein [uncultured Shewanella sp.]